MAVPTTRANWAPMAEFWLVAFLCMCAFQATGVLESDVPPPAESKSESAEHLVHVYLSGGTIQLEDEASPPLSGEALATRIANLEKANNHTARFVLIDDGTSSTATLHQIITTICASGVDRDRMSWATATHER